MFPTAVYTYRRTQLAALFPHDLLLVSGNHESPSNYEDNTYPFRQDSSFLYCCGIDQPGLALLIDGASGQTTLYGDDLSLDYQVWMGVQPSLHEWAQRAGIEHTKPASQLATDLAAARQKRQILHHLPVYRAENQRRLAQLLGVSPAEVEHSASPHFIAAMVSLRALKDEHEIAEMEKAVNTSGEMHLLAHQMRRAGLRESDVMGAITGHALAKGSNQLPYQAIVTVNGHILHNHYYGNTLADGQLLLIDAGAETERHYAGDITRTFPVAPQFSTPQREVYELVLRSQMAAIEALRPGVPYRDVHLLAARILTQGLIDLGLMQGNAEEAVAAGAHALFFPHGLGHMIGLDVHDMEDYGEDHVGYDQEFQRSTQFGLKSLRLARRLQPGFVLTVEPGLYFIPILMDRWQAEGKHQAFIRYDQLGPWRNFGGIRIEDNVLITPDGHRVLGRPIPKLVSELA